MFKPLDTLEKALWKATGWQPCLQETEVFAHRQSYCQVVSSLAVVRSQSPASADHNCMLACPASSGGGGGTRRQGGLRWQRRPGSPTLTYTLRCMTQGARLERQLDFEEMCRASIRGRRSFARLCATHTSASALQTSSRCQCTAGVPPHAVLRACTSSPCAFGCIMGPDTSNPIVIHVALVLPPQRKALPARGLAARARGCFLWTCGRAGEPRRGLRHRVVHGRACCRPPANLVCVPAAAAATSSIPVPATTGRTVSIRASC